MEALEAFEHMMKQLSDIRKNRIEKLISDISNTKMLALPGMEEPAPEIMDLVRSTKTQILAAAEVMNSLTTTVLKATVEVLNLLLAEYDVYVDENKLSKAIEEEVAIRYAHMDSGEGGEAYNISLTIIEIIVQHVYEC